MRLLVLDTENTGAQRNKAHPFDLRNRCCLYGSITFEYPNFNVYSRSIIDVDYAGISVTRDILDRIQSEIDAVDGIVGFNLKYDLHWLCRLGIDFSKKRLYCCQSSEFILRNQRIKYPSLQGTCETYGLSGKLDVVATDYWDKGFDTDQVPLDILSEYLAQDCQSTLEVFCYQQEFLKEHPHYKPIVQATNRDLAILQEMEWNGQFYNHERSGELAAKAKARSEAIIGELSRFADIHDENFNWNSGDHLSALLYGGILCLKRRVPSGTYKGGMRAGEVKHKWEEYQLVFPRLVDPRKGTELKKDGVYSVSGDNLKQLRPRGIGKQIIKGLLELAEIEQTRSLYYEGIPKKMQYFGWEDSIVHGQLNQVVAVTGRLSSSNPNLQNINKQAKQLFESRFKLC